MCPFNTSTYALNGQANPCLAEKMNPKIQRPVVGDEVRGKRYEIGLSLTPAGSNVNRIESGIIIPDPSGVEQTHVPI